MWNIHDIPIQRKLMLVISLTSITALVIASIAFFVNDILSFKDSKARDIQAISEILGAGCAAALTFEDHKAADEVLRGLTFKLHVISAVIYDKSGGVFARYVRPADKSTLPPMPGPDGHHFEHRQLITVTPIFLDAQRIGTIYLKTDLTEIDERFRYYALIASIIIFSSFLLAFAISSGFQKVIAQPVLALSTVAKAVVVNKNYSTRAEKYGQDEFGDLTDAFNQMLQEIQKQDELLKKAHEERFHNLAESANEAIISADSTGNIIYCNQGSERMFGYSAGEAVGHPLTLFMPPRFQEAHRAGFRRYLSTGEARVIGKTIELMGQRKNGAEFPIELSISSWKETGVTFFTGIIRDITERKQAEGDLRQKTLELERSNKELEEFAYAVSHDLKAPLRGICNLSEWLVQDYSDKLDTEGKEQLGMLHDRAIYMQSLIRGVLEYSRIGRQRENVMEIDLSQLIEQVIDLLQPPSTIQIEVQEGLPKIRAERTRIHQLFQNLLSNAINFMDKPNGKIRISFEDAGGLWRFSVFDNGPGIEKKDFDKIFLLFQTLEPFHKGGGTGVGLSLVKKIVDLYGGSIQVTSEAGKGSTFIFTLPKI